MASGIHGMHMARKAVEQAKINASYKAVKQQTKKHQRFFFHVSYLLS